MTLAGVKTRWRRMRADAGIADFRFHDFRHDFATKLLRDTGNLKLVQKALRTMPTSRPLPGMPMSWTKRWRKQSEPSPKSREKPRAASRKAV